MLNLYLGINHTVNEQEPLLKGNRQLSIVVALCYVKLSMEHFFVLSRCTLCCIVWSLIKPHKSCKSGLFVGFPLHPMTTGYVPRSRKSVFQVWRKFYRD